MTMEEQTTQGEAPKATEPSVETKAPEGNEELTALKAKIDALQAEKTAFEKATADKAEAERLAKLSDAEKQKEATAKAQALEAELLETKRKALVQEVRLSGGFTDKVFSYFAPQGSEKGEVEAEFKGFKEALDGYSKSSKNPQGSPSGGGESKAPTVQRSLSEMFSKK